jgi:sugar lactone lactonase YvrE
MYKYFLMTLPLLIFTMATARGDQLVLIAGGGTEEPAAPALKAKLIEPFAIDFDKAGNFYVAELKGGRVLKVDAKGNLTIHAGTGATGDTGDDGPANKATFNGMHSLAVAPDGTVYVCDTWNKRVRKIDPAGKITAFAGTGKKGVTKDGGPALDANLGGIYCAAFNADFSKLYLTDLDSRQIHFVDMKTGTIHHVAGNGKKGVPDDGADAKTAPLVDPRAACVDRKGNVYVLERSGHALRVVDAGGKIHTVAGTGKAGNSGDGGDATKSTLNGPKHLCVDLEDSVIVADSANHVVRKFTPKDGKIARLAGSGKKGDSKTGGEPLGVSLFEPHGVYVHPSGTLYIVDSMNHRVFRWEK